MKDKRLITMVMFILCTISHFNIKTKKCPKMVTFECSVPIEACQNNLRFLCDETLLELMYFTQKLVLFISIF